MSYTQKGKSFHIEQQFGAANWIIMWPAASFGQYCTDKSEANTELKRTIAEEAPSKFRLVSLTAVQDEHGVTVGVVRGTHFVEN